MKKSTKLMSILMAAAMMTSATACGGSTTGSAEYNVGVCQLVEHPALDAATQGFEEALKEKLAVFKNSLSKEKVEEIIATDDYKQKVEEIANELIDYSINGYKEDMKNRIRERLVGNVMDTMSSYGGVNLMYIINDAIDQRLHQY